MDDLTPLLSDRCRLHVILARHAPVGVVIRRGPTKRWRLTLWDTQQDRFTGGQWFHGSFYPERCDLSPDGNLFSYFAGKFRRRDAESRYDVTWIAVSRPPFLTALALWPVGDTWGGQTMFADDGGLHIDTCREHHPDHPAGPLRVWRTYRRSSRGWTDLPSAEDPKSHHPCPAFKQLGELQITRMRTLWKARPRFTLVVRGREVAAFEADWADFDQHGRLVAAAGGRVLEGVIDSADGLRWRQLADLHDEKPEPIETPEWAKRW
ncbi:hypothetical protein F183_A04050 [Bryobacterales bacterium F-183]|nr:hypothetical protein F183_A04050 [Bryobacterales bacterium F-183]